MDFTKPGYYRTRRGDKVKVLCVDEGKLIVRNCVLGGISSYNIDGTVLSSSTQSMYDIVGPWEEEHIFWVPICSEPKSGETIKLYPEKDVDPNQKPSSYDWRKVSYVKGRGIKDIT